MSGSAQPSIIGIGMTGQGRSASGAGDLAAQAARAALQDAGVDRVATVVVANALGGVLNDQECVRGQSWLRGVATGTAPVVNVDNGCAGGATALHLATMLVLAGVSPVLVVGVEKMWTGDRKATLAGIEQCLASDLRDEARLDLGNECGSAFMGLNAVWAARQMADRATTPAHFAATAVKARRHASVNPWAQHRAFATSGEVLASKGIAGPLTRLMCSSFTDGAAALVLSAQPSPGAPRVLASVLRSGDGTAEYHDRMAETATQAYALAGLGPADVDVVEVHDATSAEELYALEALGFYAAGAAGPATVAGDTTVGGRGTAVNTSGGLVARGHPLGATGLCQAVELVLQLRGRATGRQVPRPRVAMAVNTGGIINRDVASVGVHVLERQP